MPRRRLRVLTWHVHGNYLYYLSRAPHDFHVLSRPGRPAGYAGRSGRLPWGDNVIDVPAERVRELDFDVVLFQSHRHWQDDQHQLLTAAQRARPRIYLEHDPPQGHPTDTLHPVQDRGALLVHVTHFNRLMWDNGITPTRVVEHGVVVPPGVACTYERAEGIAAVNHLQRRGRRLGADVFAAVREQVPIVLVGMEAEASGGLGEIANVELPAFMARYRFFFNPIRYTSLPLSLVEAMSLGLPPVALATTELADVIDCGVNGYASTRVESLVEHMRALVADAGLARRLGGAAQRLARERFGIERFARDWDAVLREVAS